MAETNGVSLHSQSIAADDNRPLYFLTVKEFKALMAECQQQQPNSQQPPKEWLTAKECAERYPFAKTWFEDRGRAGEIERFSSEGGRNVRFKRSSVEAYIERMAQKSGD